MGKQTLESLSPTVSLEKRIMMKDIPRLAKNVQLAIHQAGRQGQKVFPVLILDGAAPSENCHKYLDVCYGATFRSVVPKLLKLAPLNLSVDSPVHYHLPDESDWASNPPETIRDQWRPMLLKAAPELGNRPFTALRREEVYAWAWKAGCVLVASEERTSYANLLLLVDPTSSPLVGLPAAITPELAVRLAWMGHMNKCVVVGRRSPIPMGHLASEDRAINAPTGSTVLGVVQALSEVWEPDYCEQPPSFATKRPLAAYTSASALPSALDGVFQGDWSKILPVERLDLSTLMREVGMRHIGVMVTTDQDTDLAVVVTNGVTREPHQGEFN
jgi:L-fucose mutarotase/ribose pyranase (RbsD/FucU family)